MFYEDKQNQRQNAKVAITYLIEVRLQLGLGKLENEFMFMVREPLNHQAPANKLEHATLNDCMCMNKGETDLKVAMPPKAVYMPNEVI